jgi:hypothetical protein
VGLSDLILPDQSAWVTLIVMRRVGWSKGVRAPLALPCRPSTHPPEPLSERRMGIAVGMTKVAASPCRHQFPALGSVPAFNPLPGRRVVVIPQEQQGRRSRAKRSQATKTIAASTSRSP